MEEREQVQDLGILSVFAKLLEGSSPRMGLDGVPAEGTAESAARTLVSELRKGVGFKPKGATTETYLEGVLGRRECDRCCQALEKVLGPPVKLFGERVRFVGALDELIDSGGGIQKGQCLFLQRHADGFVAFAVLWPWDDGEHITLKVGVYEQPYAPSESVSSTG